MHRSATTTVRSTAASSSTRAWRRRWPEPATTRIRTTSTRPTTTPSRTSPIPHLAGVGIDVQASRTGCWSIDVFGGSPAAKAGSAAGRPDRRRRLDLAGQPLGQRLRLLIKGGPGRRYPHRGRGTRSATCRWCAPTSRPGRQRRHRRLPRGQDRRRAADQLHRRLGRRGARSGREGPAPGGQGADPRPARERRRAVGGGGQRRQHLHPRRHDRLDRRAAASPEVYMAKGGAIPTKHPDGGAGRPAAPRRPRRSSPARSRTAGGPRWSAPTPTARACSRRSSRCPTAARSTSPSASTSRPTA